VCYTDYRKIADPYIADIGGSNMSRRIKEPAIDEIRTKKLGIPELLVQADCGDDFIYCAFPKANSIPLCPRCGSFDTTVHLTHTRVLRDILPDVQEPLRFIE